MELFNGRPENMEGRLPREVRTYEFKLLSFDDAGG